MTVKAFLERWMRDTIAVSGGAPSTIEKHEIAVRVHLVPALGRVKLLKLTPGRVQQFIADELAAGKGPRTVQLAHRTLNQALAQAELWGLVPRNVARLVKPPRYTASERRPFTDEEVRAILRIAAGDRLYTYVVLAHATGLRQSELLGLQWQDINLDAGVLHARKQLGRDGKLRELKTDAAKRPLPLPHSVVDQLRAHRERQAAERARAIEWREGDFVFTTRTGRPVSQRNAHRSWTRILDRAGVEHRGVHHMRHTFVTTLAENGVHERVAQQLAGHADSRMTREIYTHVTQRMLEGAANVIDLAVRNARGSRSGSKDDHANENGQVPDGEDGV